MGGWLHCCTCLWQPCLHDARCMRRAAFTQAEAVCFRSRCTRCDSLAVAPCGSPAVAPCATHPLCRCYDTKAATWAMALRLEADAGAPLQACPGWCRECLQRPSAHTAVLHFRFGSGESRFTSCQVCQGVQPLPGCIACDRPASAPSHHLQWWARRDPTPAPLPGAAAALWGSECRTWASPMSLLMSLSGCTPTRRTGMKRCFEGSRILRRQHLSSGRAVPTCVPPLSPLLH